MHSCCVYYNVFVCIIGLQLQKSTILAVEVKENDVILQEQTIPLAVSPVPQTMKLHQVLKLST